MSPGILGTKQVADLLRERGIADIKPETVQVWMRQGIIPGEKAGGRWVVVKEELEGALEGFVAPRPGRPKVPPSVVEQIVERYEAEGPSALAAHYKIAPTTVTRIYRRETA